MVTKVEKIFFAVAIVIILGTIVFWNDLRGYLHGGSKTEVAAAATKQENSKREVDSNAGDGAPKSLQRWPLPSALKEVSGLAAVGEDLWAVSDNPKRPVIRLDASGNVKQELTLQGIQMEDAEALATDGRYLYIGDVGDNRGDRGERAIYRVDVGALGKGNTVSATPEAIRFTFEGQTVADKKKKNEFDCEAMFFHEGFLYLLTKRRTDKDTELFRLSTTPGKHEAKSLGVFETSGMITGSTINASGNEVALTGYHKGHAFPFILLLKDFTGTNFFDGSSERIELANRKMDWQVESISFAGDDVLYFANEQTDDVPATLYRIQRSEIGSIHQGRK